MCEREFSGNGRHIMETDGRSGMIRVTGTGPDQQCLICKFRGPGAFSRCSAVELVTVTLPPPPGRRVPHRNCNTGEGGGCPGGLKGHGDRAGGLQGGARSGTNGGAGSLGGHSGVGSSGGPGRSGDSGGHGGSGDSGSHGGKGASVGHGGRSGSTDARVRSGSMDARGRTGSADARGALEWTL